MSRPPRWRAVAVGVALLLPTPGAGPAAADPLGGPLLTGAVVVARPGAGVPGPPRIAAPAYVVADAGSGAVLAAKAPHRRYRPASTLKVLTAVALMDELDPAMVYRARRADAAIEGSKVGIVPRATYRVHNLWQALFQMSGNDAANALANAYGSVPRTVAAMNATAERLQAGNTRARNPSGLDADGQLTSAYDLALIGRAALRSPEIRTYAGQKRGRFPGHMPPRGKPRPMFEIGSKQRFLHNYPHAIGIKNGFTTKSWHTLIAGATKGRRTILVTVLRAPDNPWRDAARLADWAFAHGDALDPVGQLVEPLPEAEPTPSASPATPAVPEVPPEPDVAPGPAVVVPPAAAAGAVSDDAPAVGARPALLTTLLLALLALLAARGLRTRRGPGRHRELNGPRRSLP